MEISRKLKQLMKVLLVVFMSLTMIVPDGMVKAEVQLSLEKNVFAVGEAIMVTSNVEDPNDWVALLRRDQADDAGSLAWFYPKDYPGVAENLLAHMNGSHTAAEITAGSYKVLLIHDPGAGQSFEILGRENIAVVEQSKYISTDKDVYEYNEPIMVTINGYDRNWVGIYDAGATPSNSVPSYYWYYATQGVAHNIFESERQKAIYTEGGYFDIIAFRDGGYTVADRKTIEIKPTTIEPSLSLDKEGAFPNYKYGEKVLVTAVDASADAWVGLWPIGGDGFPEGYYRYFCLRDYSEPVDIVEIAKEQGYELVPGTPYRLYLVEPNRENPNEIITNKKFTYVKTYYDDDAHVVWNLSEDHTTATVTLTRVDDESLTDTYDAVVGEETVTKEPTCTETGISTYPVSFKTTNIGTVNDVLELSSDIPVVTDALGHDYGAWEYTEYPHQERTCKRCGFVDTRDLREHDHVLVKHDAVPVTCTTDGNIEYYTCDICGCFFSDAQGANEIEEKDIIIKAEGHKYGAYVFDRENHKHYQKCSACGDIINEGNCEFESSIENNVATFTCKVCGGSYSVTVVNTDKEVYEYEDPIYVSIDGYDCNTGYVWVAMYEKDATPEGSNPSMYWYDNDGFDLTKRVDIRSTDNSSGKIPDYENGGEYDIVLMYLTGTNNWYNVVSRKTITIKPSTVESSLHLNKGEVGRWTDYKYNEQILVTATSPNPNASIRLCDADETAAYHQHLTKWYIDIPLAGLTQPVDILDLAIKEGVAKPEAGKKYRVYLIEPMFIDDTNTNLGLQGKFNLWLTYYDDAAHTTWKLSDDHTEGTVTLTRYDDDTKTDTFEAVVGEAKVTKAPTCTETGVDTYPLTYEINSAAKVATVSGATTLNGSIDVETAALGHDWGSWTYTSQTHQKRTCNRCGEVEERDVEAHEHVLEKHEAVEPTCTEAGNIEYYQCSVCGFYYTDANAEHEIDEEQTVLAALGHDYGKTWTFDEEKHEHYKECSRCGDRITEACTFDEGNIVGGAVVYTCSVCKGSYEDKFLWTDKDVYKQYEPMMTSVDLSVLKNYPGLDSNTAWVGIYPKGEVPAANMSIRWHYVKNMGDALDMWAVLASEGQSGSTNGRDSYLTTAGEYVIYLLANDVDGGYDKRIGSITVTLTEETLAAGEIKFEFNGKEPAMEQKFEFVLPIEEMNFKVSVEEPYGSWVGIYKAEYEKDFDFASISSYWWKYVKDINGQVIDLKDVCGEAGKYTIVVYGTGGHKDIRNLIYIEVTKEIVEEKITVEPTCTGAGSKHVKYSDGTEEDLPIEALGHEWGEFKFDGEEAKTHTKECSRCHEKVTEDCKFASEEKDGIITYTCEVCGGQYTYEKTIADEPVYRTSGPNRYFTAITAADVFMQKTGKDKLDTVVLACGSNFADALAGSYLAAVKDAPILLIDDNEKAATVENYIKEHMVKGGLVYILGGDKAVAPKIEKDLTKAGLTVKRLKGDNRYGTNLEILREAGIQGDTILVSVGSNFADSLSASATGLPVLLVKDKLTKEQKDFLSNYSGKKIYILGGPNAVNKTVEGEMGEYGTVKRIQGATRYETSTKIAEQFFKGTDTILLAVGDNFPDGLCGGALAYQLHAPVILVQSGNKADYAKKYVKNNNIEKAVVLGGENAMKKALVNEILGRDPKADIPDYQ